MIDDNDGAFADDDGCCCDAMWQQRQWTCAQHASPHACPDALIVYDPRFREYGLIIHDDGRSSVSIAFCPWCGTRLPASLRDRWFEELEALGVDPWSDDIPEAYRSEAWALPIHEQGKVRFDLACTDQSNKAVAAVLLLYHRLLIEHGFTNDQTVYLHGLDFDPFALIDVTVDPSLDGVDQCLLRTGAAIALLCELNDQVIDYADSFLSQPGTIRILQCLQEHGLALMPELHSVLEVLLEAEGMDYHKFRQHLQDIFERYVVNETRALLGC